MGRPRIDYTGTINEYGVEFEGMANNGIIKAVCPHCKKEYTIHQKNMSVSKSCGCLKTKYGHVVMQVLNSTDVLMFNSDGRLLSMLCKEDYEMVKDYRWYKDHNGYTVTTNIYADHRTTKLSRFIMGVKKDSDTCVDHCNGDRWNDCRWNLRETTYKENNLNSIDFRNCIDGKAWIEYGRTHYHYDENGKRVYEYPDIEPLVKAGKIDYLLYPVWNNRNELQTVRVEENPLMAGKPKKDKENHVYPVWETLTYAELDNERTPVKWLSDIKQAEQNGGIYYERTN